MPVLRELISLLAQEIEEKEVGKCVNIVVSHAELEATNLNYTWCKQTRKTDDSYSILELAKMASGCATYFMFM